MSNPARIVSPRPETPEPGSRQGYRNVVQLLDEEGAISAKFEACLAHIFSKYCTPSLGFSAGSPPPVSLGLLTPPQGAYLSPEGLDKWARDTNGTPFSQETKEELKEYLDVNENDCLTFKGFMQIYQLQSENDEEETWRDLAAHGFDRNLTLVASRRDEVDEGMPVPMTALRGLGMGGTMRDSTEIST